MTANNNKHQFVDPVCQMEVTKNSTVPSFTFYSKTYYFCAENCREEFISDPDKFLMDKPKKR